MSMVGHAHFICLEDMVGWAFDKITPEYKSRNRKREREKKKKKNLSYVARARVVYKSPSRWLLKREGKKKERKNVYWVDLTMETKSSVLTGGRFQMILVCQVLPFFVCDSNWGPLKRQKHPWDTCMVFVWAMGPWPTFLENNHGIIILAYQLGCFF